MISSSEYNVVHAAMGMGFSNGGISFQNSTYYCFRESLPCLIACRASRALLSFRSLVQRIAPAVMIAPVICLNVGR